MRPPTYLAAAALAVLTIGCNGDSITIDDLADIFADSNTCSVVVEGGAVSGTGNTVIINGNACIDGTDGDVTGGAALQFACAEEPVGKSAVVCTWQDGLLHTLVSEHSSYGTASKACSSPCEIDPEQNAPEPRDHTLTLRDGNTVIAGPLTVRTET